MKTFLAIFAALLIAGCAGMHGASDGGAGMSSGASSGSTDTDEHLYSGS